MHIQLFRTGDTPIRAELFSAERLEQHAKSLGEAQPVGAAARVRKTLRRRLNDNAQRLITDFRALAKAAKSGKQITSAGEWFLDNFYLVEEQIREVQKDLPADYYNELPKLTAGPLTGYPRVYGIAWALIAHTDGAFDNDRLERFVRAYQDVDPLNIGELWAIAITLRITLVENLRRLIEIVVARLNDAERAETIAGHILAEPGNSAPQSPDALLPGIVSATLITRLEQRLRNQNANAEALLQRLESELQAQGTNGDALIQEEYQYQAADDISVRNVINAMRLVSNMDWSEFVENVGLVDRVLREYPGFEAMDLASRNRYRRAIARFLFRDFYKQFGNNMRVLVTGMAPIKRNIGQFFEWLQLPLCESYGMVEAGSLTFRAPSSKRYGSVGKLLDGVEISFESDGEIVVHRENPLTLRYFQCAEGENERTFVGANKIATGDIGQLDKDGYLYLQGRKKALIITSGGYKIHPEVIEEELNNCPEIAHSVVFLKRDASHLICVASLNEPGNEHAKANVKKFVANMQTSKKAAQFMDVIFADVAFSQENGMLRPNMKIDRNGIAAKYNI